MDIEQIFYAITTTITLVLAVMTLQRLLSGWWRQYYLLGVVLVLLVVGVVPAIASYANYGNWTLTSAQKLYWILALASQCSMFLLVLQLTYRVGKELPSQGTLIRALLCTAVLVAAVSVVVHIDKRMNTFMTAFTRDLTFLTALMNMVLWRFLLQRRKKDFLLLAVSAGLGIQCTGDAIGHSVRLLSKQLGSGVVMQEFGNILMSLSAVVTIAIWHTAFSRSRYAGVLNTGGTGEHTLPASVTPSSNSHPAG